MTDDQIKHMVDRFLGWRLPENFSPDAGISFKPTFNENTAWPMKHEPTGTNLFDHVQATAMIRYMVEGLGEPATPEPIPTDAVELREEIARVIDPDGWATHDRQMCELKRLGQISDSPKMYVRSSLLAADAVLAHPAIQQLGAQVSRLTAERDEMEKVLKPFAKVAPKAPKPVVKPIGWPHYEDTEVAMVEADWLRAAAALLLKLRPTP